MSPLQFFRVFPLAIILWLEAVPAANAQESPLPPPMHASGLVDGVFHFAGDLGRDVSAQASYPLHLARNQPARFIFGATMFLGLVATDDVTRDAMVSPTFLRENGLEEPARWISDAAAPSRMIPVAAGIGVIGLFGSPRERQTGVMLSEALITSSIWTGTLKYLTGRERPRETSEVAADWTGPGASFTSEPVDGRGLRSFPSGHTSGAWAMATVFAHQYPSHGIVPLLAYGTATAMGYSRMAVGAHWLSDVVVGGLIGYGCARQVISSHEERDDLPSANDGNHWSVFLESNSDMRGAGLSYQF